MTDPTPSGDDKARRFNTVITRAAKALERRDFRAFEKTLAAAEMLDAGHPEVAHFRGLGMFEQKDIWGALKWVSEAVKGMPENAYARHNLAAIQIALGRFGPAQNNLRKVLTQKPDYPEAYHTLACIHQFRSGDRLIRSMEQLARSKSFSRQDASFLSFALAKAYDDTDQPDLAWPMLEQANAQMKSTHVAQEEAAQMEDIKRVYSKAFVSECRKFGYQTETPVFVVGLPRSGTTLLESLLDAHPQVFAAGELITLDGLGGAIAEKAGVPSQRRGFARAAEAMAPSEMFAAGLSYLNEVRKLSSTWFERSVDKMPDNSFNLGLVACCLPGARVVHVMRHPLDVMLSIYLQRFTSMPYGFRVQDIVAHWRNYEAVMAHWREVLPDGMMLELRYENLVQDRDYAQQALWSYLGLPQNVSHVLGRGETVQQRTASRWQVKQPVYTTSREKFRKYETHMSAFIEAIGGMDVVEQVVEGQKRRCALVQ